MIAPITCDPVPHLGERAHTILLLKGLPREGQRHVRGVAEYPATDDEVVWRMEFEREQLSGLRRRNCRRPLGCQKFTSSCGADALSMSNQDRSVTATKSCSMIGSFYRDQPSGKERFSDLATTASLRPVPASSLVSDETVAPGAEPLWTERLAVGVERLPLLQRFNGSAKGT